MPLPFSSQLEDPSFSSFSPDAIPKSYSVMGDGVPGGSAITEIETVRKAGHADEDIPATDCAAELRRRPEERFHAISRATQDVVWDWNLLSDSVWWSDALYDFSGFTPRQVSSNAKWRLSRIHPDDREEIESGIRNVIDGEGPGGRFWTGEYRFEKADGTFAEIMDRGYVVRDAAGCPVRMVGAMLDLTPRKQVEEKLRESEEYLRRLIESSPDCIKMLDLDGNLISMTEGGQKIMDVDDFSSICGVNWLTFWTDPDTRQAVTVALENARKGGRGRFQGFCPTMKGDPRWWDVVVVPMLGSGGKPEQLLGVSRDVTEEKQATDRERSRLMGLFMQTPAFMATLQGPRHLFEMANPPFYQSIGDREIIGRTAAEALPELVDQGVLSLLDTVMRTGKPYVGTEVSVRFHTHPDGPAEERILDFTFQPLKDEDGIVTGILVHGIDRTARKRLERERENLLAEAQARVARESLLNQVGAAVRATLDPDAILQSAVTILGKGLDADRCYFVRYNQSSDTATVYPEWFRRDIGIDSLSGHTFRMSRYSVDRDPSYKAGNVHVVKDVVAFSPEDAGPLLALNVRSLVRVPIDLGDHMTALAVGMAHEPRDWTQDEIMLVENVASLVRSTLASAYSQQRERNIARQLQDALFPPDPPQLDGLRLASYYRPALAEAGVGGDFYDVFEVAPGHTALVVADLSGKGLAAASQLATLKNMLRYALYSQNDLGEAVAGLHRNLVCRNLLVGFATLFVGVYDSENRALKYVNCGQDPALVWRSEADRVELLEATGPVLGGFDESAAFREKSIGLKRGDVLAMFTDGLSEAGRSRKSLLEIGGVSALLSECCGMDVSARSPQAVVDFLVNGVEQHAGGPAGIRDDIALLVGIVTEK